MGDVSKYEQMSFALQNVTNELRRVLELTGFNRDPAITVSLRNADVALERAGLASHPDTPSPAQGGGR